MLRIFTIFFLLCVAVEGAAQRPHATSGALIFSAPRPESLLPPSSSREDIEQAYRYFGRELRDESIGETNRFFKNLTASDTAKFFAKLIYTEEDANPFAFFLSGASLVRNPALIRQDFLSSLRFMYIAYTHRIEGEYRDIFVDTERTERLLTSDIIADVKVADTAMKIDPYAQLAKRQVAVRATVCDPIKGKIIPYYISPLETGTVESHAAPDAIGSQLDFSYSLDWGRRPMGDMAPGPGDKLIDLIGRSWIQIDSEYIVFLRFEDLDVNNTNDFFALWPLTGGMYPVHNGIVDDPNDDFGIGASKGLPIAEWKRRLRGRIAAIVNP